MQDLKIKNENEKEKKLQKSSKKFKQKTESIKNHSIHRASKEENFYHKIKLLKMNKNEEEEIGGCINEEVAIFSDTGVLLDFVYKSEQLKKMLIDEIKDIILCMKEVLYRTSYLVDYVFRNEKIVTKKKPKFSYIRKKSTQFSMKVLILELFNITKPKFKL